MDIFDTLGQNESQQRQPYESVNFEGIQQGKPSTDIFETLNQQQVKLPEKEKLSQRIPREAAQYTSRAVEYPLGIPHSMIEGASSLGEKGANLIRGAIGLKPVSGHQEDTSNFLPSSENIREKIGEITKGYTEPKSKREEKTGEFVQRLTGVGLGGNASLLRGLGIAGAGMLAKEGIKAAGGSETAQNMGDLGASIIAGALNLGMTKRASEEAYKQASRSRPTNAMVSFEATERSMNRLKNGLLKGGTDPDKQAVITKIDEMMSHVKNGKIPVSELEAFHQQFNKMTIDRTLHGARKNLKYLNSLTMNAAKRYGRQNPEWYDSWTRGNQIHKGVAIGKKIAQNIENTMSIHPLQARAGGLATLALFGVNPALIVPALKGAAATSILSHTGALATQVYKNPELRRLYTNALLTSMKDNPVNLTKNLQKLSNKMEEEIDLSEFIPPQK